MGAATSSSKSPVDEGRKSFSKRDTQLARTETEVVQLMMPLYYSTHAVTSREREFASRTWNMVLNDTAPGYVTRKENKTEDFPYQSSVSFFYDTFYCRLFDIHPMCKHLFRSGMKSQGNFLVKMISLALSELEDPRRFDTTLRKLAEVHYERGVKAFEYGIVGEVLFWVLKHVLGKETYTKEVHIAWVKIYNRMLHIMVPVAVALELHTGPSAVHAERLATYAGNMFHADSDQTNSSISAAASPLPPTDASVELKSEKLRLAECAAKSVDASTHRTTWSTDQ